MQSAPTARRLIDRERVELSPPQALALLFLLAIALGTVLLKLPGMTTQPITWLESAFTVTSAVTVTGLAVVDTGSTYTFWGQLVILALIQVGGLGMMIFAILALLVSGGKPRMRMQLLVGDAIGQTRFKDLRRVMRLAIVFTVAFELVGSLLLAWRFGCDLELPRALWYGVFHCVSAFNNAGFGLWSDSMVRYATDPLVNLVLPLSVLAGGAGYVLVADPGLLKGRPSAHSRMMLVGSAVLVTLPTLLYLVLEMNNPRTLGGHTFFDQLQMAWFQVVIARTAGFNSIDLAGIGDGTSLLTMVLMLIGGGTGSTAGGMKVTTVFILALATLAVLRQQSEPTWQHRRISNDVVMRAFAVVSVTGLVVLLAALVLLATQRLPPFDVMFEVVSAIATVGLSRGITAQFDAFGQVVLMVLMFAGRLGPLTLVFSLATAKPSRVRYPVEEVYVG